MTELLAGLVVLRLADGYVLAMSSQNLSSVHKHP